VPQPPRWDLDSYPVRLDGASPAPLAQGNGRSGLDLPLPFRTERGVSLWCFSIWKPTPSNSDSRSCHSDEPAQYPQIGEVLRPRMPSASFPWLRIQSFTSLPFSEPKNETIVSAASSCMCRQHVGVDEREPGHLRAQYLGDHLTGTPRESSSAWRWRAMSCRRVLW